jgi:hypothetical protein
MPDQDANDDNRPEGTKPDEIGEGNRDADRRYRKATEEYVKSGRSDSAGKEARRAVDDEAQREDLKEAERRGRDTGPKPAGAAQDKKR